MDNSIDRVERKVLVIRKKEVLLDRDIAELYGVETRVINQAVKRNIERFPEDYRFQLSLDEFNNLKSQSVISSWGGIRKPPFAFTEKGLYMLATVIKSPMAIEASFAIIETFTNIRQLAREIHKVNEDIKNGQEPNEDKKTRIQKAMNEVFTNNLPVKMQKTTFSANLGFIKFSIETTREKEDK